jgi:hypothetical protein
VILDGPAAVLRSRSNANLDASAGHCWNGSLFTSRFRRCHFENCRIRPPGLPVLRCASRLFVLADGSNCGFVVKKLE